MDQVINRLSEWKEKILFGVVVLATLLIVLKARPIGGSIVDIDAEQRKAAISAAGIDQAQAEKVITKLEKPPEWTPVQLDSLRVERPFYEAEDDFKANKPTGWSLSQETYESLPPVQLSLPGFSSLPDYDMPAGLRPGLSQAQAYVPRDERPVSLTRETSSEFD